MEPPRSNLAAEMIPVRSVSVMSMNPTSRQLPEHHSELPAATPRSPRVIILANRSYNLPHSRSRSGSPMRSLSRGGLYPSPYGEDPAAAARSISADPDSEWLNGFHSTLVRSMSTEPNMSAAAAAYVLKQTKRMAPGATSVFFSRTARFKLGVFFLDCAIFSWTGLNCASPLVTMPH